MRAQHSAIGPWARAWGRFKSQRRALVSLWLLGVLLGISLLAELVSNDKPYVVHYQQQLYFPLFKTYPETTFGGDFPTPSDYLDPFMQQQLASDGNWAIFPPNRYAADTLNYFASAPNPAPPSHDNLLGTDDKGRDLLARLLYGFRTSALFALALTLTGSVLGVVIGGIQGYFGGRVDLFGQRVSEIWAALPELYLLIIFTAIFAPSLSLLLILMTLLGWMGLADYTRAEFLRHRNREYVLAARSMGLSDWQIIRRHVLPNSLTPVLAFLPFRMGAAILALTSLDFLGLGVGQQTASLGELLAQGKANLDAWWISMSTFAVLLTLMLLLVFIGEGLRQALDPRSKVG